jgi:hypothetical protein
MFLEHGELWDEHLVDDMYNPVVCDHVRQNHVSTIDLAAFPTAPLLQAFVKHGRCHIHGGKRKLLSCATDRFGSLKRTATHKDDQRRGSAITRLPADQQSFYFGVVRRQAMS